MNLVNVKKVTMSNELKIQLLRRSCCNTIFAGCVEPYCYTDEDWLEKVYNLKNVNAIKYKEVKNDKMVKVQF